MRPVKPGRTLFVDIVYGVGAVNVKTVLRMRSRISRSKPQRKEERLPRMTRIQQISRIKNYELQNKKFVV